MMKEKKKKLCFVIQSFDVGGSSKVVYDILMNMDRTKYQVSLIVFFNRIDNQYKSLINLSNLEIFFLGKTKTIDLVFLKRLKKTLKIISPDIISTHLTCVFYLNFFVDYKKTLVFHTIHSKPCKDIPKIYRLFIQKKIHERKILLVGVTNQVSKEAELLYKTHVYTICNGIKLLEDQEIINTKKYDFLFVGRFSEVKRISDLIDAFSFVNSNFPASTLCLCGKGPEENAIRDKICNLHLSNNVTIFSPEKNVNELYKTSKIFCLFSSREGAPIVILEAMNYGLPIIASNVGGIPSIMEDKKNGFLITSGNVQEEAQKMQILLNDSNLLNIFSAKSKELVKKYSIIKTIDSYLNLFEDCPNEKAF